MLPGSGAHPAPADLTFLSVPERYVNEVAPWGRAALAIPLLSAAWKKFNTNILNK
jgi:hypothetical protein